MGSTIVPFRTLIALASAFSPGLKALTMPGTDDKAVAFNDGFASVFGMTNPSNSIQSVFCVYGR